MNTSVPVVQWTERMPPEHKVRVRISAGTQKTLESCLLPDVVENFNILKEMRNYSIHFHPETDKNDRSFALQAIKCMGKIISNQFSSFAQPWFITDILGELI